MTTRENTPIRRSQARDHVAAPTGETMTSDMEVGQSPDRLLKSRGNASGALSDNVIERVSEQALDDDHTEMLAFMAEPVTVRIAVSTDPNAEQVFEIIVNGRTELFRRGETKTVPRYYVDRMLRMKETRYKHREVMNQSGDRDVVYDGQTALKYDFSIVRDMNPLSESWYRHTLAEQG